MFFLIILIILILYLIFYKESESFNNLNVENLNSIIINNVNESDFSEISTTEIYNFFQNIYSSYEKYESALIIFNNRQLFNRLFILEKKDLNNNIITINRLLSDYNNYNVIDPDTENSNFWNIILIGENNFKDNINNIIENSNFLKNVMERRRILMSNDNLRILFKSIFDDLGVFNFNS